MFTGGHIWTGLERRGPLDTVAVRGGRVVGMGTMPDLLWARGPRTRVIDLGGRLLVPAFGDAHVHPLLAGLGLARCWLADAPATVEAYLDIVRDYAAAHPDLPWIIGEGWSLDAFPGGLRHGRPAGRRRARPAGVPGELRRPQRVGQQRRPASWRASARTRPTRGRPHRAVSPTARPWARCRRMPVRRSWSGCCRLRPPRSARRPCCGVRHSCIVSASVPGRMRTSLPTSRPRTWRSPAGAS